MLILLKSDCLLKNALTRRTNQEVQGGLGRRRCARRQSASKLQGTPWGGARRFVAIAIFLGVLGPLSAGCAFAQSSFAALMASGIAQRNSGQIDYAIGSFSELIASADSPVEIATAKGELGATLVLAHRFSEAEPLLQYAFDHLTGDSRARYAIDLGNLAFDRHQSRCGEAVVHRGFRIERRSNSDQLPARSSAS